MSLEGLDALKPMAPENGVLGERVKEHLPKDNTVYLWAWATSRTVVEVHGARLVDDAKILGVVIRCGSELVRQIREF
jgi:hypothetical protein